MHPPQTLITLSLLALRASAFVVLPSSEPVEEVAITVIPADDNDNGPVSTFLGLPQTVALNCPGCLFEGRENVPNKIVSLHLKTAATLSWTQLLTLFLEPRI
jgi:hypothetical protein